MGFKVVIPARYASSRLPGKPLKDIAGKPMIQRVYEQAKMSRATEVIVATDDVRIQKVVEQFGGEVMMTSPKHESGTDRLQEVARLSAWSDEQLVVGVQGDEPLIPPVVIDQVAENLACHPDVAMATLQDKIETMNELMDPNVVKTVCDREGMALYFSRSAIPFGRDCFPEKLPEGVNYFRHIGIYGYRVSFLHQFAQWEMSPLEKAEKLEQLRAMWYGAKIHLATAVETPPKGVDTQADLDLARTYFKSV
ncbi:MAG: 3-deoxy-manno-octulosonate cytidylyltransferase [Gammaproteobacteria bacterium]|nr:3-deoxy-manno-octulosonate cytidylyltransferase [Gammaproteobacteria bacterium]